MTNKDRMVAPDTIDAAIHFLTKLQSEGFGLESLEHRIKYGKPTKNSPRLPIGATLTIKLIPSR